MAKNVNCNICTLDYDSKDTYKIQACKCVFCIKCLGSHLKTQIMNGADKMNCPTDNCPNWGYFSLEEIGKIAGQELLEKHKAFLNKEVVLDIKACPKCEVEIEKDKGCFTMICKNCWHSFCWECVGITLVEGVTHCDPEW